ncbi:MAG: hypothetical protein J5482_02210 [Oscillospiraceae bacterium]|nr:hypothetical protein [Oscillospiraceae bacterium]
MYYLRKNVNGEELAVYKHHDFSRFYRGDFRGTDGRYQGMKLYTCKTLKRILSLRQSTYDYCGDWYDVYDENGKVTAPEIEDQERQLSAKAEKENAE